MEGSTDLAPTTIEPTWQLRPARPEDGEAVGRLFTASFALLDFLPKLHTPAEDLWFFRKVVAEQRVTVAEDESGLIGFVGETEGWINHLYVRPDRLRAGIGSALLRCAQGHQSRLELWCFQKNLGGRAFYEAHGFEAAAFTDGAHNEEREPDIRYVWSSRGP